MAEALIIDAVRTPRGKRKGSLAGIHAVDLAAHVLNAALERTGAPPEKVEEVVLGCVTQIGEQAFDVARGAVLAAGLPISVPGKTVNRLCGSGLTAVADVASGILAGQIQLGIGGGGEAASAEAVHRLAGDGDREAGGEDGAAGDVEGLLADLGDAAEHHVLDLLGRNPGALEGGVQHVRCQVDRVDPRQASLPLAAGGPDRIDDQGFSHGPRTRRD